MSLSNWLPLVDYSNKYRISISTLRRRIKLDSIPFKLDGGKYYIIDESPDQLDQPSQSTNSSQILNSRQAPPKLDTRALYHTGMGAEIERKKNVFAESVTREDQATTHEPVFSAANRLLDELKKAYTLILQEKDEQIRYLREEISDLKTLVRVLESENARLSRTLGE